MPSERRGCSAGCPNGTLSVIGRPISFPLAQFGSKTRSTELRNAGDQFWFGFEYKENLGSSVGKLRQYRRGPIVSPKPKKHEKKSKFPFRSFHPACLIRPNFMFSRHVPGNVQFCRAERRQFSDYGRPDASRHSVHLQWYFGGSPDTAESCSRRRTRGGAEFAASKTGTASTGRVRRSSSTNCGGGAEYALIFADV